MISKTAVARETARRVRVGTIRIGEEILRLRLDAGVSLRELSAVTGLDPSHLARIEKGTAQASLDALTRMSVVLGADLSLRFYAGAGPRIRDRFQAPMLETLLRDLDTRWTARLEVPIPRPARGIVDLVLTDPGGPTTVIGEAQSELRQLEQQLRWFAEKADAISTTGNRPASRLLILRSTEATREIARRYQAILRTAYPARTKGVIEALTGGAAWPGDGIVWMRLQGGVAELLRYPPRGVALGR